MHTSNDVEIKSADFVYNGVFKIKALVLRHKRYSGEWTPWINREQVLRHNAVSVILYDPERDMVVLVEQLRVGALTQDNSKSPWLLEVVAGLCDYDEPLEETARREAIEEAECEIKHLIPVCEFYPSPGGFTEKTHLFCGIVDSTTAGTVCGMVEEHEDIQVRVLPAETVLADLSEGRLITSSPTVIALLWLQQKRMTSDWKWQ